MGPARPWLRFSRLLLGVALALFAGLAIGLAALDPYDTGRLALVVKPGVPPQGPRTAHASRARDPSFDAAVIGNSHVQLLSPSRLTALTGMPFVSLTVPATGPKEQLAILDFWLTNRTRPPGAVVVGVDPYWCRDDPAMANWMPFPFWLYAADRLSYLQGLVRLDTLEEAGRRMRYLAGRIERARPDGYWDYEPDYLAQVAAGGALLARLSERRATTGVNATGEFPPLAALRERLARLPATTRVILVRPPVYETGLPEPQTPEAATDAACAAAYAGLAASDQRVALLDWRVRRPESRIADLWFDHTHYRAAVAIAIEREIAERLR